ncbi:MAG TPA: hypothetical protein VII92_09750 [Anaerolineae bacterium]
MTHSHFVFAQLSVSNLTPGKAFDGLTVVETHDMNGRSVKVEPADLAIYLKNTQAAIAAAKSATGEIVGLPIDAGATGDHDKGDAGGWIVGAELAGNVLRLIPKWTELGVELITKSIRRFFSATVDVENKVILGGTLTNWPAVRDAQGKMLLRPIELSKSLYELAEAAQMDQAMMDSIKQAFMDQMMATYPDQQHEVVEVADGYLICKSEDSVHKVTFKMGEGGPTFAPRDQWETVETNVVEAAMKFLGGLFKKPQRKESEMKFSELNQADRKTLAAEVLAELQGTGAGDLRELASKLIKDTREQALAEFRQQADAANRQSKIAELSVQLIEGTTDMPRGLKNVTADDLAKHLNALPADESKFFSALLAGIVKDGLVEFSEKGHGRKQTTLQPVPDWATVQLKRVIEVGETQKDTETRVAKYFELSGLGDPKHYDLTSFVKSGNGKDK